MATETRNWDENSFYKLNNEAKNSFNELSKLNKKIREITRSGKEVDQALSNSFEAAKENAEEYINRLIRVSKRQDAIISSAAKFKGLDGKRLVRDMGYSVQNGQALLKSANATHFTTSSISNKTLAASYKTELVQLGAQLAQTVANSIAQGFERAAAISESMYTQMASDSVAEGDWLSAKKYFDERREAQRVGFWKAAIVKIGGQTATGALTGGFGGSVIPGVGTVAGAGIGGGIGFVQGVSEVIGDYIEDDAKEVEHKQIIERTKKQLIKSTEGMVDSTSNLTEERRREKLLSDPEANLQAIKAERDSSLKEQERIYSELKGITAESNQLRAKPNLSDDEIQKLLELNKEYAKLNKEYENLDKISKSYDGVIKSTESVIAAKEKEAKAEKQAIADANRNLTQFRRENTADQAREDFSNELSEFMEAYGDQEGFDFFHQVERIQKTNLQNSINAAKEYEKQLTDEINKLDIKRLSETATSDDIKKQRELETERANLQKQITSDEELINGTKIKKELEKSTKDEVKDIFNSAQSSKYLADDFGSFSRYFGKTDPSLNLMKETNELLKGILRGVETINICTSSNFQ